MTYILGAYRIDEVAVEKLHDLLSGSEKERGGITVTLPRDERRELANTYELIEGLDDDSKRGIVKIKIAAPRGDRLRGEVTITNNTTIPPIWLDLRGDEKEVVYAEYKIRELLRENERVYSAFYKVHFTAALVSLSSALVAAYGIVDEQSSWPMSAAFFASWFILIGYGTYRAIGTIIPAISFKLAKSPSKFAAYAERIFWNFVLPVLGMITAGVILWLLGIAG